jgi:hypothetical protein
LHLSVHQLGGICNPAHYGCGFLIYLKLSQLGSLPKWLFLWLSHYFKKLDGIMVIAETLAGG